MVNPTRRATRLLTGHAIAVGLSPFLLLLALLPPVRTGFDHVPEVLAGGMLLVLIGFSIPVSWPFLIAVALFEGRLAEDVAANRSGGVLRARRVIRIEAVVLTTLSVLVALAVAASFGSLDDWGQDRAKALGLWIAPAALAGVHWALASSLGQPDRARGQAGR